jgi:hypothetical protein
MTRENSDGATPPGSDANGLPAFRNGARTWDAVGKHLDSLTRLAAVGGAAVYFSGFLILSLHLASYGIGELDPFRTRILATGITFAGLSLLGGLLGSREARYIRDNWNAAPHPREWFVAYRLSLLLFGAFGAAVVLGPALLRHVEGVATWTLSSAIKAILALIGMIIFLLTFNNHRARSSRTPRRRQSSP